MQEFVTFDKFSFPQTLSYFCNAFKPCRFKKQLYIKSVLVKTFSELAKNVSTSLVQFNKKSHFTDTIINLIK